MGGREERRMWVTWLGHGLVVLLKPVRRLGQDLEPFAWRSLGSRVPGNDEGEVQRAMAVVSFPA